MEDTAPLTHELPLAPIAHALARPTADLPPRLAGSLWECNEGYELTGARISWPGGVFAAEPETCKPI